MTNAKKRLGIIGFGSMGSSIAFGVRASFEVCVFDKDKQKLANNNGLKTENLIVNLVKNSDVIILAVKPQDFDIVLEEIKSFIKGKLVISIAAG